MSYSSTGTSDSGSPQQDQAQQHSYLIGIVLIFFPFLVFTFVITFVIVIRLCTHRTIRYPAPHRGPSLPILSAAAPRPQSAQLERGLLPAALAAIPRFPYERRSDAGPAECAVCLSEVEEGEVVRELPGCGHLFHVDCIDMWLHSHPTCPVCRVEALPKWPVAADVEAAVAPPPNPCDEESENQMAGLGPLRRMSMSFAAVDTFISVASVTTIAVCRSIFLC